MLRYSCLSQHRIHYPALEVPLFLSLIQLDMSQHPLFLKTLLLLENIAQALSKQVLSLSKALGSTQKDPEAASGLPGACGQCSQTEVQAFEAKESTPGK